MNFQFRVDEFRWSRVCKHLLTRILPNFYRKCHAVLIFFLIFSYFSEVLINNFDIVSILN